MDLTNREFMEQLASKAPVPGGGGASALIGAVAAALCSMVANLTTGKKKYAAYQEDIEHILAEADASRTRLLALIGKDAEVFAPLAEAYGIPKDAPGRDELLEKALLNACSVPLAIVRELSGVVILIEELQQKGSRLAVSDVGVAAASARAAMESAVLNVYINTKLMKDTEAAQKINEEAAALLTQSRERLEKVYHDISNDLRCK